MSTYYVYQLRLENSELPFYIGKGVGDRAFKHLMPCNLKHHSHKNHTILKAIRDGVRVVVEIIHQNLTERESLDMKILEIAKHGRADVGTGYLTNGTDGGDGSSGHVKTAEHRAKISAANKGKKRTPETRAKMSVAFKGRKLSPEHVERIKRMNTGRKASDEAKKKMSIARIGKKRPEHGAKVSAALTGVKHDSKRIESNTFSQWDRNPNWYQSDVIYLDWVAEGRPGLHRFKKKRPDLKVDTMVNKFIRGWIPSEDPVWNRYHESRG